MVCEKTDKPDVPYSYAWAARELSFSVRTIATLVRDGRIGYVAVGRFKRIYPEHIKEFKRANEHKPRRGRKPSHGATY